MHEVQRYDYRKLIQSIPHVSSYDHDKFWWGLQYLQQLPDSDSTTICWRGPVSIVRDSRLSLWYWRKDIYFGHYLMQLKQCFDYLLWPRKKKKPDLANDFLYRLQIRIAERHWGFHQQSPMVRRIITTNISWAGHSEQWPQIWALWMGNKIEDYGIFIPS